MHRIVRVAAVTAAGALAVAGLGPRLLPASPSSQTFQMYANVDAEGDLGSNFGAVRVTRVPSAYEVQFSHPIGSCAAQVQAGKAGGSDPATVAESVVIPTDKKTFFVQFTHDDKFTTDPFMLTVTCKH